MHNNLSLVWFRSDLRIADHPALYHASRDGEVIGIYLLFSGQWQKQHDGLNKLCFWMQNLKALEQKLEVLNIPLIVLEADSYLKAPEILLQLATTLECTHIWFNDEYGVYEQDRDNRVEQLFDEQGLHCHRFIQQTLFHPGSIRNKQGEYFKVFTPFRKALHQQVNLDELSPLSAPEKQKPLKQKLPESNHYQNLYTPTAPGLTKLWPAGEAVANKRLKTFIEERADHYKKDRDFPVLDSTSTLSPWLAAGAVSIRQCFYQALVANDGELNTGNEGLTCWINELIWREFYKHILVGFPRVSKNRAFKPETENLPREKNPEHLAAWQQGRTGFPIVDAAMRQLVSTGWMHNRLRMIVAMFLSKNLMLDWRLGELFFMEHLIDGDLAANNGGWQWSASTGTDAAPYFRMFNPASQSRKFDPEGSFIREWLPELAQLDSKAIHEPHASDDNSLNYPLPAVNHSESRQRVLTAFQSLKACKN